MPEFEEEIKQDIIIRRLQALITAGVTVGDQEVRDTYRKENIKIKFDYAVISADDLRKTINPSDATWRHSSRRMPRVMPPRYRKSARSLILRLLRTSFPAEFRSPRNRRFSSTLTRTRRSIRFRSRLGRATFSSRWLRARTQRPMPRPRPKPRGF